MEVPERSVERFDPDLCHPALLPDLRDNDEHHCPEQSGRERPGIEHQRKWLHQHHDARGDDRRRDGLQRTASQNSVREAPTRHGGICIEAHLRTAPKVMPRSKCLRKSTVKTTIGTRKSVVPAATAGQSCPPSPIMIGMKGGAVCALPEVKSTAKAYSFQAKMRQKIAVAAIPVVACGSTTFTNACKRVYPSIIAASSYSRGISSMKPLSSHTASETLTDV